jgi:hypothetical protein
MLINIAIFDIQFRFLPKLISVQLIQYCQQKSSEFYIAFVYTGDTSHMCTSHGETKSNNVKIYSRLQAKNSKFRIYVTVACFLLV